MEKNYQAQFRLLTVDFLNAVNSYDQDKVMKAVFIMENWIDQYAEQKRFDLHKKDIKIDVSRGTDG